ncbi:MAG: SDR family NAD(P)-dependent oxidoreductase, partial [Coprobacillus sp.]
MNKVAIITGASRGIGKAIVLKFASKGYDVVINYRGSEQKAMEVKDECLALGVNAMVYQGDVSCFEEMDAMMKAAMETYGRIDVLVNNSGITKDN